MEVTIDLLSTLLGFIFGLLIMSLFYFSNKKTENNEDSDFGLIDEILIMGRWVYNAYTFMKDLENPLKKDSKKSMENSEIKSVVDSLVEKRFIIRVDEDNKEEYKLTFEGENLVKFLDAISENIPKNN
jgi:hypothetical protein